jgi:hypothetical protein
MTSTCIIFASKSLEGKEERRKVNVRWGIQGKCKKVRKMRKKKEVKNGHKYKRTM